MFVDTHAHLSSPEFANEIPAVIDRARAVGVEQIVSIATNLDDARRALTIARDNAGIYAAIGLHPGEIPTVSRDDMQELERLANDPKVVAIGETGLDYYRGRNNEKAQKDLFRAHLELARHRELPVVIHNRAADADCLEMLRTHGGARGVMHCFGGDERFAFECLELGLFISFTGILTFKNAAALREVAGKLPLDKIMLETDSPYLAPHPHRGKRNEPSYVPLIAQALAEIKNVALEEIARITTANAERLFKL